MREWRLNNHKLLCGDSTDKRTVIDFIGNAKVQAIFTDPPYKMTYSGSGCFKSATKNVAERIKK